MKILITGFGGLLGSEAAEYFASRGYAVSGIDNNIRADFFGPSGDTSWRQRELGERFKNFKSYGADIRNRKEVLECVFVHMSTNKVYGDALNKIKMKELETRWDYDDEKYADGIDENFAVDQSKHSLFGASKLAADVMVQEYGRYFGMKTCCLRGGCLTGPNHSGMELHGFLRYLVKVNLQRGIYRVYGYKGKQVRDFLSARDLAELVFRQIKSPDRKAPKTINAGGGISNAMSLIEMTGICEEFLGRKLKVGVSPEKRRFDIPYYVSDIRMAQKYWDWKPKIKVEKILEETLKWTLKNRVFVSSLHDVT